MTIYKVSSYHIGRGHPFSCDTSSSLPQDSHPRNWVLCQYWSQAPRDGPQRWLHPQVRSTWVDWKVGCDVRCDSCWVMKPSVLWVVNHIPGVIQPCKNLFPPPVTILLTWITLPREGGHLWAAWWMGRKVKNMQVVSSHWIWAGTGSLWCWWMSGGHPITMSMVVVWMKRSCCDAWPAQAMMMWAMLTLLQNFSLGIATVFHGEETWGKWDCDPHCR